MELRRRRAGLGAERDVSQDRPDGLAGPGGLGAQPAVRRRDARPMSDRRSDRADRLTAAAAERDLLPLRQCQTAALQATAATRANPTGRDQPPGAVLAISASRDSSIGVAGSHTRRHPGRRGGIAGQDRIPCLAADRGFQPIARFIDLTDLLQGCRLD